MKPSYKSSLLGIENGGVPYAAFAQADFTAEHEQELDGIYRLIGGNPKAYEGLASYSLKDGRVDAACGGLAVFEHPYLWNGPEATPGKPPARRKRGKALCLRLSLYDGAEPRASSGHWRRSEETDLSVCYDSEGFEIMAYTDAGKGFVRDVETGIRAGDFACFRGGGSRNPFDRGGLVIAIPSRVPDDLKSGMLNAHADTKKLLEAAEATGIEGRIKAKAAGSSQDWRSQLFSEFRFYALAPAWSQTIRDRGDDRGGEISTAHPVIFFLNPGSRAAKAGWYTVEELDEWIKGKGPVLRPDDPVEDKSRASLRG